MNTGLRGVRADASTSAFSSLSAGGEHAFARSLPARLRAQGLVNASNEGRVYVMKSGSPGTHWAELSVAHLRGRLVGSGKLTEVELDRMLEIFEDPDWEGLSLLLLAAWGRRAL